jgi:L-serine dehydratase
MYQYNKAAELMDLCQTFKMTLAEVIIQAEMEESGMSRDDIWLNMKQRFDIMKASITNGMKSDLKSKGGLIGGNGRKLFSQLNSAFSGKTVIKAVSYALAVTEVSASMGKIVASPTAGASGILPGVLQALGEDCDFPQDKLLEALFVAAGLGRIISINATLSGAEGGCQAECGSASAMAAASAAYLAGGSPEQCFNAAAMALKGLLGLVCDPVAGLVEVPCSKRNATSTANALICADMSIADIHSFIPFDEVVEAMHRVGQLMSPDLRETARGGCAAVRTALEYEKTIKK